MVVYVNNKCVIWICIMSIKLNNSIKSSIFFKQQFCFIVLKQWCLIHLIAYFYTFAILVKSASDLAYSFYQWCPTSCFGILQMALCWNVTTKSKITMPHLLQTCRFQSAVIWLVINLSIIWLQNCKVILYYENRF